MKLRQSRPELPEKRNMPRMQTQREKTSKKEAVHRLVDRASGGLGRTLALAQNIL